MKLLGFFLFLFTMLSSYGQGDSLLNKTATISGFGSIKYREPINKPLSNIGNTVKRPIVLFHGIYGGASHRTWRKLLPLLDKAGERVFIMDLPGVGESDKPKRSYTIEVFDNFVEKFLEEVVGERANLISESILSNSVLRVASKRPDLVRRVITINPSGVFSLNEPPSPRENGLYNRLFNDDQGAIAFYKNLLNPNSLRFFLAFGFFDDTKIDEDLISDFLVMRDNVDQRFLTLSFVGGQLYRTFEDSSAGVFVPVLALFGEKYEAFQDNRIARSEDFAAIRPFFDFKEIPNSGASIQREQPEATAEAILDFLILD